MLAVCCLAPRQGKGLREEGEKEMRTRAWWHSGKGKRYVCIPTDCLSA